MASTARSTFGAPMEVPWLPSSAEYRSVRNEPADDEPVGVAA